ncbi:MAG: hypothetical protein WB987_08945 [Candidatus Acidiferrales bacterium]
MFATLALAAGDDDLVLLLTEVDVSAGACEAAAGAAAGGAGCGLLAALAAEFGFLEAAGTEGDFAFDATAGAVGAGAISAAVETGTGEVSATVRTAETGALAAEEVSGVGVRLGGTCATISIVETGFGLTTTAAAGAAFTALAAAADRTAAARVAARVEILLAIDAVSAEASFGSTNGGKSGKVVSGT